MQSGQPSWICDRGKLTADRLRVGLPVTKLYQDKEWLQARLNEGLTNAEIALLAGCYSGTVSRYVGCFKLKRCSYRYQDREWLRVKYCDEGLTCEQIAVEAGCSASTIGRWMDDFDIPRQSHWESSFS